jgi:UDP-N-acetylmuramoyl-tripeptide--D-alanyl-D-alanine ligase
VNPTPILDSTFVAQALSLAPPSRPIAFSAITTDSRKAGPGTLFVAIAGDTHDGHTFIAQAIAQGVSGVVCREDFAWPNAEATGGAGGTALRFAVPDTIAAYRHLGGAWRRGFSLPVLAIAGSEGKTTTKELLAAVLTGRFAQVLKTTGSQNGFVGIPMTLLELRPHHGAAVIEVGIDEIGAMAQHMPLVQAGYATLTSIGPEHLEKLKDVPTVAHEEGLALDAVANSGGTVGVCLDDPWIAPARARLRGLKVLTYSLKDPSADVLGRLSPDGGTLEVTAGAEWSPFRIALPLLGRHNAMNLLSALTLAHALGLTPNEVEKGLASFQGAEGRSQIRELPGPIAIVCDYYNANPTSMAAGFQLLAAAARQRSARRQLACLADMRELGPDEERFHRELAPIILTQGIETVYLFGPKMKWLQDELQKLKYAGDLRHFAERAELAPSLRATLRADDALLLKGSNSMKLEEVWRELQKGPPLT